MRQGRGGRGDAGEGRGGYLRGGIRWRSRVWREGRVGQGRRAMPRGCREARSGGSHAVQGDVKRPVEAAMLCKGLQRERPGVAWRRRAHPLIVYARKHVRASVCEACAKASKSVS